tara:strand:+ start:3370 stop:3600 length:231 start_codon:yes stop_codon:yes gene_type:complete
MLTSQKYISRYDLKALSVNNNNSKVNLKNRTEQKKPAKNKLAKELIDKHSYINLLIIKPFKAGATEPNTLFISIDS